MEEILENVKSFNSYEDIINELKKLSEELKNNNINYNDNIDCIISHENISNLLDKLIIKYNKKNTKDKFILLLIKKYREKNKESDPELIEILSNKTRDNQSKIIKKFDRFVYKCALKKINQGVELDDLVQVGRLGLLRAYEEYDLERGTKFTTASYWWIMSYMQKEILKFKRTVRIPAYLEELLNRMKKYVFNYLKLNGKKPTIEEIALELDVDIDKVKLLLSIGKPIESLDREVGTENENDKNKISNLIPDSNPLPDSQVDENLLKEDIDYVFKKVGLSEREIYILKLRYGIDEIKPYVLEEIAKKIDLSRERVRQIENNALRKIKNSKYIDILKSHLQQDFVAKNKEEKKISTISGNEVKRMKKKERKKSSLEKSFLEYDTTNLAEIVANLPEEDREIVYKKYGNNLDKNENKWISKEANLYYSRIRAEIIKQLGEPKNIFNSKTLAGRLKIADKEIVIKALDGMYPDYLELIYKKYGKSLEDCNTLTKEEEKMIDGRVLNALKRRIHLVLEGKHLRPMQMRVSDTPIVEENIDTQSVTNNEIKSINSLEENSKEDIRKELIENKKFELNNCAHLEKLVFTSDFIEFIKERSLADITIASLVFGYLNDYYDIDSIAEFLNIKRESVVKLIRNILIEYKKYINEKIDAAIEKPVQKILH